MLLFDYLSGQIIGRLPIPDKTPPFLYRIAPIEYLRL